MGRSSQKNNQIFKNVFKTTLQNSKPVSSFSSQKAKYAGAGQHNLKNSIMSLKQHQDLAKRKNRKERDRYKIQDMNDIDEILELSRNRRLNLYLNDYIFAFLRISELTDKPYFSEIYGLSEILENIQYELKKRDDEDDPLIGRLALSFKRANFASDKDLWINLCDHILGDIFDPQVEEVYAAIQGFTYFSRKVEEQWQLDVVQQTLQKLHLYVGIHLKQGQYNFRTLCVLTKYLVLNRVYEPKVYTEIERVLQSHLREISMDLNTHLFENKSEKIVLPSYQRLFRAETFLLEEFSQFGFYFASVDYYSEMLFHFKQAFILEALRQQPYFNDMCEQRKTDMEEQQIRRENLAAQIGIFQNLRDNEDYSQYTKEEIDIELEILKDRQKMQQEEKKLVELSWPLSINGNVASNLLQYFNYAHTKNPSNELKPNTKAWLFYQLKKPENEYTIENLYNIHKAMHQLEIENEDEFNLFMENKLFEYQYKEEDHEINLEHIKEYIEIRTIQEFEGDYQKMNPKVYEFLDSMCEYYMKEFDSDAILLFTYMIDDEQLINRFPKFLSLLPQFVNDKHSMYDFEELCYFCLICHKDAHHIQSERGPYWNAVIAMKELIKVSTYSRGFKMDMESNFHKLLQHVDIAEFFGEGTY